MMHCGETYKQYQNIHSTHSITNNVVFWFFFSSCLDDFYVLTGEALVEGVSDGSETFEEEADNDMEDVKEV